MTDGTLYNDNQLADITGILRSLLANELGTFANGRTALWVEPPKSPTVGVGLHVYIKRQPSQVTYDLYRWDVTLRQYDRTNEGLQKMDDAIAKIRKRFPNRREIIPPFREDDYPQAFISLEFQRHAYPDFG